MRELKFRSLEAWEKKGDSLYTSNDFYLNLRARSELTWEQFTGLLDKNGKEIYEGDILYSKSMSEKYSDNTKWMVRVVFEDASFCMGHGGEALDKDECSRDMEIIGNVHQNQELIKELR